MPLKLVTRPAEEPLSLEEAKLHLRQDGTEDDALISGLIVAARQVCETRIKRAFIGQTWDLTLDGFPPYTDLAVYPTYLGGMPGFSQISLERAMVSRFPIRVPLPPLKTIVSLSYVDVAGVTQVLAPTAYQVVTETPGRVYPKYGSSWPASRYSPEAVIVRFTAGYGTAADVPDCIRAAMKLLIGDWYENRESALVGQICERLATTVDLLLSPEDWGSYT